MSTLAEIEAAADSLPPEQKQELFLFLAERLRATGHLPAHRDFGQDRVEAWIADDEAGMQRFRERVDPALSLMRGQRRSPDR